MKKNLLLLSLFALVFLLFAACEDHISDPQTGVAVIVFEETNPVTFLGGATVTIAGRSATTDSAGRVNFIGIPTGATTITATKAGYADVSRPITIRENEGAVVSITMVRRQ